MSIPAYTVMLMTLKLRYGNTHFNQEYINRKT